MSSFEVIENTTDHCESAIVSIALSCTAVELFDVEEYRDLEI